jgi:hypothetical protein
VFRPLAPASLVLFALLGSACTDFATPAELQKTTILAVVSDPPVTPPGAQSRLELVVVDQTGRVPAPASTWRMVETFPGVPPMGTIADNGDGTASYTAPTNPPAPQGETPPIDSVEIELATMPRPLTVLKAQVVADVPSQNPTLATLTVDGADATAAATARAGQPSTVAVTIDPPAGKDATYAWYTTLGKIEEYQSAEATLEAEAAGSGWLFVVVRDGLGGVAWHATPLTVQ